MMGGKGNMGSGGKGKQEFNVEILPDGTIKATANCAWGPEIHQQADDFMAMLEDMAGGKVESKPLHGHGKMHSHVHADGSVTHHSH